MELLNTLVNPPVARPSPEPTVNTDPCSAFSRRALPLASARPSSLSTATGRLAAVLLATSACALAQVSTEPATTPTEDPAMLPEPTAPTATSDAADSEAVSSRSLFAPATMTSRAVYTEETSVIAEPADVWAPSFTDGEVFRTGQITIRPGLRYLYLYGDGMLSRPGVEENSSIHAISPTVAIGVGDVWTFSYAPVWTIYSNDRFSDTLNHRALLRGQTEYQAWRFGASQGYTRTNNPLAETASQTEIERFNTQIEADYELNSRTRIRGQVEQNIRSADTASDLREWIASAWVYYQTGPAMSVGAGIAGGYLDIEDQSNMSYGRLQGQLSLDVSEKVTWSIRGGVERRSFLYSDADTINKPLLGTSIVYRPVPTTLLSLDYDRSVGNSIFQNRVTETDTVGIRLNQRLLQRFNLSVAYTRREMDFVVNELNTIQRDDRIDTFTASLGTQLMRRLSGSVLYRYTQNDTNVPEFAYESDQFGVELRYGF